jgi:hypothetical protein
MDKRRKPAVPSRSRGGAARPSPVAQGSAEAKAVPEGAPPPARSFPARRNFASLSIRDLLEAREHYHVHLSNLENVVATAIGRYRIHERDFYADHPPDVVRPPDRPPIREPRTLANSVVRAWSWPCVLVFVRRWQHREEFASCPDQAVPRTLYLPDGRSVPTCVVRVRPDERRPPPVGAFGRASELLGGGYVCFRKGQGIDRLGTLGCLVEREGATFALTNQHVAGTKGERVFARVRGQSVEIGESEGTAVTRITMASLFPGWPGERTYVTLDAGLIRVSDLNHWTSQVFGIGELGKLFDFTLETVSLDIIGLPVRAFGGVSGALEGEIQALFFRYESKGGYDYVADLLIGPRSGAAADVRTDARAKPQRTETLPGDSGTLWFHDPPRHVRPVPGGTVAATEAPPERGRRARRLRPLAMQWGGERLLADDGGTNAFALATFLSTILRVLDLDLVRSWSLGHDEYWGKIGHFAIGWKACGRLTTEPLRSLMLLNQGNIGFGDERLKEGSQFRVGSGAFVPLADVPDYIWVARSFVDSADGPRRHEPSQHFADMDGHAADGGPSLLARCRQDPANLAASVWREFFGAFEGKDFGPEEGALPFRVWQIYEAMVQSLRDGDLARFVSAAGVLAHYVGDASQPLHVSELHHGRAPTVIVDGTVFPVARHTDEFKAYKEKPEYEIHGLYEQRLFEIDALTALEAINDDLAARAAPQADLAGGHAAALATFELMSATHTRLPPETIIDADDPTLTDRERAERFWNDPAIRVPTLAAIADSTQLLARLWESAWQEADVEVADDEIVAIEEEVIEAIYRSNGFLPAFTLQQMAESEDFEPPV